MRTMLQKQQARLSRYGSNKFNETDSLNLDLLIEPILRIFIADRQTYIRTYTLTHKVDTLTHKLTGQYTYVHSHENTVRRARHQLERTSSKKYRIKKSILLAFFFLSLSGLGEREGVPSFPVVSTASQNRQKCTIQPKGMKRICKENLMGIPNEKKIHVIL